jgi:tRNA pseudouridine38-40 synthase
MRYFIYLSFKGTDYCGWQIQPNSPSVQECVEKSLSLFLRSSINIVGAGRTDTGVHARMMVAHFDLQERQDCEWMKKKMNGILPSDIAVIKIVPVIDDAHARFDAVSRTYRYYLVTEKEPFENDFSWRVYERPDFELMNCAAKMLLDVTDFTSFSKLHTDAKTNNCRVFQAEWSSLNSNRWVFTITADRFLRNMVRAIVGTLMEVGRHQISLEEFSRIIEKKNRCAAGDSAPAQGLFLEEIEYPQSLFDVNE